MSDALNELQAHITARQSDAVVEATVAHGELTVEVMPNTLVGFVEFLKMDTTCTFQTLVDITAVDYPGAAQRFAVVYHFLSMYQNQRIRVKTWIREDEILPSITPVHASANWFEREVFDMFGILFSGHPDLRNGWPRNP